MSSTTKPILQGMVRALTRENADLQRENIDLKWWLENGCDPKDAAKELRFYERKIQAALETT
jgi:hypothetical protein